MEYRQFGRTGLRVSEVGLGFGPPGFDTNADYTELLRRAVDLGVNFIDTADFYGAYRSEEWIGKALSSQRADVIIATKFGTIHREGDHRKDFSVAHMRQALEESLKRLRTDYVDIYQLHSPPGSALESEELLSALRDLKQAGTIRYYGVSADGQVALDAVEKWDVDAIQIMFSLFHQEPAERFFPLALERGVGVIIRSPLDSGMLGGELMPESEAKLGDPRERWGEEETALRQRLVEEVRFLSEGTGRSMAQAALDFVLSFDAVSVAIPGTTSIKHLEENVAAAGGRLSKDEMARLRSLREGEFRDLNLGW
jgi:aryl-alcohol dehydrogenase-like predicted oxidoreductase